MLLVREIYSGSILLLAYDIYSKMSEQFLLDTQASCFSYFFSQLEEVELLDRIPLIPPVSPRLGEIRNISLRITPDIANGEIGFTSNLPIILSEPEELPATVVSKNFCIVPQYGKLTWRKQSFLYPL